MKTFLAVLTAGLVLFGIYLGWLHFDRWQQSRNYCVAEIEAISERSLPSAAFYTVEAGQAYLREAYTKRSDLEEACKKLVFVLDHKAFHLPLSGDEKKLRENCTSAPDEQK